MEDTRSNGRTNRKVEGGEVVGAQQWKDLMHQAKKIINDERIACGSEAYFMVKAKKKKDTDKLDKTRSKIPKGAVAAAKTSAQRLKQLQEAKIALMGRKPRLSDKELQLATTGLNIAHERDMMAHQRDMMRFMEEGWKQTAKEYRAHLSRKGALIAAQEEKAELLKIFKLLPR